MVKTSWVHLLDDAILDLDRYIDQDENDPRVRQGPCVSRHGQALKAEAEAQPYEKWGGNPSARWSRCVKCGLRFRYYPKAHQHGRNRENLLPHNVLELSLIHI